jgi:flagellar biogenesis protein FliO
VAAPVAGKTSPAASTEGAANSVMPPHNFMSEEQLPISGAPSGLDSGAAALATPTPRYHLRDLMLMCLVFICAGVVSALVVRFLKRTGKSRGTRKYLVEQLSFCPLGNKSGVSLLKIGGEFVLVGVTPQQVSLLSALPKLEAQYEDDAQLERSAFREAVHEELSRIHGTPGLGA